MTADNYGDIEPSVVVNRYVENNVTVDRAIIASTKFYNGNPWHYWTAIGGGQFLGGWLNAPPGCDHTSDPMIAENPFTTPGTLPLRTYIVGTSYSLADGHTTYNEMSLWYKDNFQDLPNPTWSRQTVEWTNYPYFFDKPSLAVSWYPQRLGWVYVACVMVNTPSVGNPTHTIYLFRGTPFGTVLDFGYGALNRSITGLVYEINSPIVMVDDQNGDVYVAWVDQLHNQIKLARSTDQGETFSSTYSFSTGLLLPPTSSAYIQDDGGHTVAAPSMLMGKLHAGHIGLVWHQYETSTRPRSGGASYYTTDVYFRSFDTTSQTWLQAAPVHVGTTPQNDHVDQWNPALDVMSNGDFMVSWYDKRDDAITNRSYFVYAKRITAAGNPVDADVKLELVCQWTGNPADQCGGSQSYRSTPGDTEQLFVTPGDVGRTHHLIGDYQDFWVWYSDYGYGGTIFTRPNMNGDPFLSQVFP